MVPLTWCYFKFISSPSIHFLKEVVMLQPIRNNWIVGIWKFDDTVPMTELVNLANELSQDKHGIHRDFYIRKTSKNQIGLGFTYMPIPSSPSDKTDTKKILDAYIYRVSDMLKRKFGNQAVRYDISSPVHILN